MMMQEDWSLLCVWHTMPESCSLPMWVDVGFVNGAMGAVEAIWYKSEEWSVSTQTASGRGYEIKLLQGHHPSRHYSPHYPQRRTWLSSFVSCFHLQLSVKHSRSVIILSMTLDNDRYGKGGFFRLDVCGLFTHSSPDRSATNPPPLSLTALG